MDSETTRSASTAADNNVGGSNFHCPGINGSLIKSIGSRSGESLLAWAIKGSASSTNATLTSKTVESFEGSKEPGSLQQTLQLGRSQSGSQNRNPVHGLYDATMAPTYENEVTQNFSRSRSNCRSISSTLPSQYQFDRNGAFDMDNNDWRPISTRMRHAPNDFPMTQVQAFSTLPYHILRQINQTSGNKIIHHFSVNLLRVHGNNIVGSTDSVAVFTTKTHTDKYWLMSFLKKRDWKNENTLRFNRLLTSHLVYNIIGETAIEIDSSKPNSRETIKFVFNFASVETAAEFTQILEQLTNRPTSLAKTKKSGRNDNSLPSSALTGISSGFGGENSSTQQIQGVRFMLENASIFIQNKCSFRHLGTGTLKIVHNGNSFDKVVFEAGNHYTADTAMQHYIYKWNEMCILPELNSYGLEIGWNCFWTACAEFKGSPDLPKFRTFKMEFGSKEEALGFYNAFQTSVAVAEQIGCIPGPDLQNL